jgi:hypothetical protein
MNRSIALSASLIIGFLAGSTGRASAVVSCQYVGYPPGCVVERARALKELIAKLEEHLYAMN